MEQTASSRRAALRAAFPATIPVMTGFLCLGVAYGVDKIRILEGGDFE